MKPLQHPDEFGAFLTLLKREGIRSYLEIGSKFGGSLRLVADVLPIPAKIVSVDLPKNGSDEHLKAAIIDLQDSGHDAAAIFGDSTDPEVIAWVSLLGKFDCLFIDGDHSEAGVRADWTNYADLARIVAFHDISNRKFGVRAFWNELKQSYRHEEIRLDQTKQNGIGVLWR